MKKHRFLSILSVVFISICLIVSCATTKGTQRVEEEITYSNETSLRVKGQPYHLVVLGTSDIHGNIWGYSYEDGKETTNNGMVRLTSYINKEREKNPHLLLIDAGDAIQGTIMTDDIYNKNPYLPHPMMTAFNELKYDVLTLGNHEFNWGIKTMQTIIGQAKFPVLAANVKDKDGNYITGRGHIIISRDGVKIAIIGVVSPNVPLWDGGKQGIEDTVFESANTAVKKEIELIGDKADIIIVQAHMGEYAEFDEENGSDSGLKIIEDNPEVDILQVAHMHTTVSKKVGKTLVGGVKNNAREIVKFDLTLDDDNKVTASEVSVIDMKNEQPNNFLRSIPSIEKAHNDTITYIRGTSTDGSSSTGAALGTTSARFQPENEIRGIPEGKLRPTAVMTLINKVQKEASGADVSAAALFKDTSDLPKGNINYGNIFDIYKFDNTLYRVKVTGEELKGYMEWSAECYNTWKDGDINISFDPEYPGYLYDMFLGVDYEIDLSEPKGERIKNVMFNGTPLKDDDVLTLAVNNYRYSSALKGKNMISGKKEWESSGSIRDLVITYLKQHSPLEPEVINNWKITGVDLQKENPKRAEIINLINSGKLEVPYAKSYNIHDYDTIMKTVK